MKLYLMGEWCFIEYVPGYMLAIGTKTEIDEADDQRILELIHEAIARSRYYGLETTKQTVN